MFGVGLPELAVLAFIGVVVFGPDKLPELARQAAGLVRRAKKMADTARDELRSQLGPDYADLELRDLDPRALVRKHVSGAFDDLDDGDSITDPAEDSERRLPNTEWLSDSRSTPSLLRRSRRRRVRPASRTHSRPIVMTRK